MKSRTGLPAIVLRTLREECAVDAKSGLLLGVSGGPDSMALLTVLVELAPLVGYRLVACGVDHGLRAEAAAELDAVERYCNQLCVSFKRCQVTVEGQSNIQATARDARYKALSECAAELGLNFVVTAHHQDDRAETVLLRLLRGAGPDGLAVLAPRLGDRLRPMVRVPKATVTAYVAQHGIPHIEDPSNRNPRFLRVQVRNQLLPVLRELSPAIVDHLCNLADELSFPTLPEITDTSGEVLVLNRSQRAQLRRAIGLRQRSTQIWLSGGHVITFDPETGEPKI